MPRIWTCEINKRCSFFSIIIEENFVLYTYIVFSYIEVDCSGNGRNDWSVYKIPSLPFDECSFRYWYTYDVDFYLLKKTRNASDSQTVKISHDKTIAFIKSSSNKQLLK